MFVSKTCTIKFSFNTIKRKHKIQYRYIHNIIRNTNLISDSKIKKIILKINVKFYKNLPSNMYESNISAGSGMAKK